LILPGNGPQTAPPFDANSTDRLSEAHGEADFTPAPPLP
jgi:hypothetical protein